MFSFPISCDMIRQNCNTEDNLSCKEALKISKKLSKRRPGRPAFVQRLECLVLGRHGSLPQRRPALGLHHPPHLGLHLRRRHHLLIIPDHLHAGAHLLHHENLVLPLLRVQRPADERQPRHDRLQRRVPPAVRHEGARRTVPQHVRLRHPRLDDEAAAAGALQEPLRQQRGEVRLHGRVRQQVRPAVRARALHHPQEPLPGPLQPDGDLLQLLHGEGAHAPEAEEHDALLRLRVQPRQALVLLLSAAGGRDHRPDAVDGRHGAVGDARAVPDRAQRRGLQPLERVDDDAPGLRHPLERVQEALVHLVVAVERELGEVGGLEGAVPREGERRVADLAEAGVADLGLHAREVEVDSEAAGAAGVEDVGRHAELGGDVDGVRAEAQHVEHEGAHRGQHRAEVVAERRVHAAQEDEGVGRLCGGVRRGRASGVDVGRRGQHVEADGRVGRRGARDGGRGVRGLARRAVDDDGGGEAAAQEELGQLHHGHQVAHAEAGVENHRVSHGRTHAGHAPCGPRTCAPRVSICACHGSATTP
uniref:Uncharacterized protein n=1 Tax=Hordeum vulgare subsp. vulgare TaxID=112509 RepID=A0A8I6WLD9_HORVV